MIQKLNTGKIKFNKSLTLKKWNGKKKKKQMEKKFKYPIKNNPKPILFIIDPS